MNSRVHVAGPIDADGVQRCLGCNVGIAATTRYYLDVGDQVVEFYDPALERWRHRKRKKRGLSGVEVYCHTDGAAVRARLSEIEAA